MQEKRIKEDSRILILDDTAANILLLKKMLSMKGYVHVETLEDSRMALETCISCRPDLLILDLRMPYLDGFQVLDQLKSRSETEDIPVIVISADQDGTNVMKALEHGALDYIEKPFEPAEVLMRIRNILENRMLAKKVQEQNAQLEQKVDERTKELEDVQEELFLRLLRAAEFRDNETGQHIARIGHYVYQMALLMGISEIEAKKLLYASMMHDIGKIAIPDHILLKPGKLTDDEFEIMKQHTTKGAALLSGSNRDLLRLAEQIALTHHERWDGKGYPLGLSGNEIPLAGRITAVFDVFDALTSNRPYKKPWPSAEALQEIRRLRGLAFDPQIVDLFIENLSRFQDVASTFPEETQ